MNHRRLNFGANPLSFLELALFCVVSLATLDAQESVPTRKIALLLDEPPKLVMRTESDVLAEIADQIDRNDDSISTKIVHPTAEGWTTRNGEPVPLDEFDVLWIHQGTEIVQNGPLFSEAARKDLKNFLDSRPDRGVLLTGGAVALFDSLGFGPIEIAPVTFGEDRSQAGLVPIQPQAAVFQNVQEDRGTLWITNAAFCAFDNFASASPNVRLLAKTPGGQPNPLLAGTCEEGDRIRVKSLAFGWRVSPLFDHAAPFFQNNLKSLLTNLLKQTGQTVAPGDFVPPPFLLPDFEALRRSVAWLCDNYDPEDYPDGEDFLKRLERLEKTAQVVQNAQEADSLTREFETLQKEALLANPILDFDEILLIRRNPDKLGLPQNYNSNSVIAPTGYQNELARFNFRTGEYAPVYKPENDEFLGDVELYYDAKKLMFSMPDVKNASRWRLWELSLDSPNPPDQPNSPNQQNSPDRPNLTAQTESPAPPASSEATNRPNLIPLINDPDVDNYDACYLPDDRIVFCSTACQTGVPCIDGSGHVCNLYLKEKDGSIRQLTLEQDHDWNPTVMNNGRVMYLRWEYTDLPHAFSRILFHANPDGTNQSELYGSGSYWPATMFYARPIPDHPTKFVAVVGGHHELERRGDLVLFDPALGRQEAEGAIQRIPGFGKKVQPTMIDLPIAQTWPKFLHPFPLSENYFLVACQRSASTPWEICLVDVFDNIVTLAKQDDRALLEPIPLRETKRQTILPDRIRPNDPEADVFIADVYEGQGLQGVPRGEVKAIRLISYQFSFQGTGAEPHSVGLDGPWDPKRVLGTVPVFEDGSASFKIPAYTPVALQPLDRNGKAVQLMRSWITALPGEAVSCIGCHEKQNSTSPTTARTIAAQTPPVSILPFAPTPRGFSFEREIQPILDRFCVDCHQAESPTVLNLIEQGTLDPDVLNAVAEIPADPATASDANPDSEELSADPAISVEPATTLRRIPDFRRTPPEPLLKNGNYINVKSRFSNAYYQLRRFVRTQTKESQMPVHKPFEFHADSDYLVQLLENGHYNVRLDPESWNELLTWIDLNAPYYGNWGEIRNYEIPDHIERQRARRDELRKLYTGIDVPLDDLPNAEDSPARPRVESLVEIETIKRDDPNDWRRNASDDREPCDVPLSDDVDLALIPIPGTNFSLGKFEITNEQFAIFDPTHDSGIEYGDFIQFSPGEKGWLLSRAKQPVVRVTWEEATAYCDWLSEKTGETFRLPTEDEWKFAAAAGTQTPFWFGDEKTDYSQLENLGDSTLAKIDPIGWTGRVETLPAWRPVDWNRNDRSRVAAPVGSYAPNPFGLFDVQGNVSEWTASEVERTRSVQPSPEAQATSETQPSIETQSDRIADEKSSRSTREIRKIVCGGSWYRPARRSTLDSVLHYPAYENVFDVGFRVLRVDQPSP